jgi:hypothetical protein
MTEECRNCRFWMLRSDSAGEAGGGFCRRYPPSFPSGLRIYENLGREVRAHHSFEITTDSCFLNDSWPYVHQQSWCGEWKATP